VSEYCIKKALNQIDETDYVATLTKLASEKYQSLKREQYLIRKRKQWII
jgi:regulatory protein